MTHIWLPAIITALALGWAAWTSRKPKGEGDVVVGMFAYAIAVIVSLGVWLVWALVA